MEAVLIDIRDEASLSVAREAIRGLAVDRALIDRAVLVATELGRNQLRHAQRGTLSVDVATRGEHRGVELTAVDHGAGLADFAGVTSAAPRQRGSLGVGVGSVLRLSSELDVDVRIGEGTQLRARLFAPDAPRRRELAVYGRPIAGELVSGDHAGFARDDRMLALAVCDGLGHGAQARAAADGAIDVWRAHATDEPGQVIADCHRAIAGTRGVVMAAVRIDEAAGTLTLASVGNIEVQAAAFRSVRRFGGSSAVVGGRPGPMKARSETIELGAGEVLLLMTDGITSKAAIDGDGALLRSHPAVIAQRIFEQFARPNDDALVLVAR